MPRPTVDTGPVSPDPFTQVYRALWGALDAFAPVTQVVKIGNRVDYAQTDEERTAWKAHPAPADLPELELVPSPEEARLDIFLLADTAQVVDEYLLRGVTDDERLHAIANPLRWNCLRAICRAGVNLGLPFVQQVRVLGCAVGPAGVQEKGEGGWQFALRIRVTMEFDRTDLTEDN
jgi:hypothetical protein